MQAKDIKTGVVYARQPRKYDDLERCVVVDVDATWRRQSQFRNEGYVRVPDSKRCSSTNSYSQGYLAVVGIGSSDVAALLRAAEEFTADSTETVSNKRRDDGTRFVIVQPRELKGGFAEVADVRDAERKAEEERRAKDAAESKARLAAAQVVVDSMHALVGGHRPTLYEQFDSAANRYNERGSRRVTLAIEQVQALVDLARAGKEAKEG